MIAALLTVLAGAVVAGTIVTGSGPHGGDEAAPRYGFELDTVVRVHSVTVLVFVALLLLLMAQLRRERCPAAVQRRAHHLLGASVAQGGIGWTMYLTNVPALLVGIHVFGAAIVSLYATRLAASAWSRTGLEPSTKLQSPGSLPLVTH